MFTLSYIENCVEKRSNNYSFILRSIYLVDIERRTLTFSVFSGQERIGEGKNALRSQQKALWTGCGSRLAGEGTCPVLRVSGRAAKSCFSWGSQCVNGLIDTHHRAHQTEGHLMRPTWRADRSTLSRMQQFSVLGVFGEQGSPSTCLNR